MNWSQTRIVLSTDQTRFPDCWIWFRRCSFLHCESMNRFLWGDRHDLRVKQWIWSKSVFNETINAGACCACNAMSVTSQFLISWRFTHVSRGKQTYARVLFVLFCFVCRSHKNWQNMRGGDHRSYKPLGAATNLRLKQRWDLRAYEIHRCKLLNGKSNAEGRKFVNIDLYLEPLKKLHAPQWWQGTESAFGRVFGCASCMCMCATKIGLLFVAPRSWRKPQSQFWDIGGGFKIDCEVHTWIRL